MLFFDGEVYFFSHLWMVESYTPSSVASSKIVYPCIILYWRIYCPVEVGFSGQPLGRGAGGFRKISQMVNDVVRCTLGI